MMSKIESLNLKNKLNVIILSDHGMTNFLPTNQTLLVQGDLLNMIDTSKTTFGVPAQIFPKDKSNVSEHVLWT